MGTMSRDRVEFTINYHLGSQQPVREAFKRAFDLTMPTVGMDGLTVICRPSQFARFLIYRNECDGRNGFKELNARLFVPEVKVPTYDVSGNNARYER